jgi:hypothetical protein
MAKTSSSHRTLLSLSAQRSFTIIYNCSTKEQSKDPGRRPVVPTSVFVKTQNGREEVRLRSQRLSARERATLIMVDGKRSVADLCMMSPTPAEVQRHLQTFLEAGLIAAASEASQGQAPRGEASSEWVPADYRANKSFHAHASASLVPPAAGVPPPDRGSEASADLEKTRQYILEVAEETLGPDAASYTDQLARLHNVDEILNLARHLRDVLYRFTNVQEADQFLETVREIAPKECTLFRARP